MRDKIFIDPAFDFSTRRVPRGLRKGVAQPEIVGFVLGALAIGASAYNAYQGYQESRAAKKRAREAERLAAAERRRQSVEYRQAQAVGQTAATPSPFTPSYGFGGALTGRFV